MTISLIIGLVIVLAALVIIPYIKARNIAQIKMRDANEVIAEMANDIQQEEQHRLLPLHPRHLQNSRLLLSMWLR